MIAPPFLVAAALAFWGWQAGHLLPAVALGAALELPRYLKLRLELGVVEHSRIADLSTVGFVTLAVLLAANRGVSHGILEAFVWAPVALAPIMLAQLLAESGRIPLSALFRYMRKLRRLNPEIKDPPVDVSMVYVALAVIAAGVANSRGPAYYIGVVIATAWALATIRPRHASIAAWLLMLVAAAGAGHAGQAGLAQLQAQIETWVIDFNLRGLNTDPYRSVTEIGSIGRLKQYDEILLRVYAAESDATRVQLLHSASYNTYAGTSWLARGIAMQPLESAADNTTWTLAPGAPPATWRVGIVAHLDRGKALLPLPAATTRITGLNALEMRENALGTVHVDAGTEWVRYEAQGAADIATSAPPTEADAALPAAERAVFERVAAELGLRALSPAQAVQRVERHFAGFRYALYRERAVPAGETALGDFMTRRHAGHCEYFAAATTLLLRAAGIPSRYATGYAVMERSALEDAYIVRSRHAHAWSRAWVGGRWIDVDTTPPAWFPEEAGEAPFWEKLADLARWAGFRWTMREEFKANDAWYGLLGVLALILAWRMFGGRRVARRDGPVAEAARRRFPGEDSEFFAVEKSLSPRAAGETHGAWLQRIAAELPASTRQQLGDALRLHQRYRFDPRGLAASERARLRELCSSLVAPVHRGGAG
jgi:hypothetical protein